MLWHAVRLFGAAAGVRGFGLRRCGRVTRLGLGRWRAGRGSAFCCQRGSAFGSAAGDRLGFGSGVGRGSDFGAGVARSDFRGDQGIGARFGPSSRRTPGFGSNAGRGVGSSVGVGRGSTFFALRLSQLGFGWGSAIRTRSWGSIPGFGCGLARECHLAAAQVSASARAAVPSPDVVDMLVAAWDRSLNPA